MKIEHLAIWVSDVEKIRKFCEYNFHATAGERYVNSTKKFTSYFLSFVDGPRLELIYQPEMASLLDQEKEHLGLNHFAVSPGLKNKAVGLMNRLRNDSFRIISEPRTTGDGYDESVIFYPKDNRIEIMI